MSPNSKSILMSIVCFMVSIIVASIFFQHLLKSDIQLLKVLLIVAFGLCFTPIRRVKEYSTGKEYQLKWWFSSRVLIFK